MCRRLKNKIPLIYQEAIDKLKYLVAKAFKNNYPDWNRAAFKFQNRKKQRITKAILHSINEARLQMQKIDGHYDSEGQVRR